MALRIDPEIHEFRLSAVYFDGIIDLKLFRSRHTHYPVLATDPLVVELVQGQWAVLTKFGAVIVWNAEPAQSAELYAAIQAMPGGNRQSDKARDTLVVRVGPGEPVDLGSSHNELRIRELTLDKLRVISLALGQSVALEHFELEVHRAIHELQPRIDALRTYGRLLGAERAVLRDVGFVLTVRAQVLANLTLFDKPPEAWESEAIDRLDSLLYDHFDLDERTLAINAKVQFLSDLNSTFLEILNHRKSVRLEQVVVVLILVEIGMGIVELVRGLH